MKYPFALFALFLIAACTKDTFCNGFFKPVELKLEKQSSVSYIDLKVGSELVPPFTYNIWNADQSPTHTYRDTIDIKGQLGLIPDTLFIHYSIHCLDGSYSILRDTLITKY